MITPSETSTYPLATYTSGANPNGFVSKDPEGFAQLIGFIWRLVELICVVLLLVDVISRMSGKALYFIHAARFIIFSFGASAAIVGGLTFFQLGTRGYMTMFTFEFFQDMYGNYLGWYLPNNTEIFNEPTTTGGYLFTNATFWEQVILLILLLTWGIMKLVLKKAAMMSKVYHLFKSLFLVFFIAFMFPLIYWGGIFWKNHSDVKDVTGSDTGYLGYWFNWIMMFFWFIVGCFLIYSMAKTSMADLDEDKTVQANYEKPDFVHERHELTDAQSKSFLILQC